MQTKRIRLMKHQALWGSMQVRIFFPLNILDSRYTFVNDRLLIFLAPPGSTAGLKDFIRCFLKNRFIRHSSVEIMTSADVDFRHDSGAIKKKVGNIANYYKG